VTSLSWSPDRKRFVSGSEDKTVKVWDAQSGQPLLSLIGHTTVVTNVSWSPDGKRIISAAGDPDDTVKVWDAVSGKLLPGAVGVRPESGRVAVHGNRRVFADGNIVRIEQILSPRELAEEQRIAAILRAREAREYHEAEVESATMRRQFFAAVFHLDRLMPLLPENRKALLASRSAVLSDARKSNANAAWASRALARQAIGDPKAIRDRDALKSLRDVLGQQKHAANDRLYGALLLRTGATRKAILVLRAALRNREGDVPPVEELLLALAHIQRHQPDEARKYLKSAVAWMNRGTEPVRAASLLGLRHVGPLSALGGVAVSPPDPRLVSLDPATAHELVSLRAEVEKALAKEKP
jgi:hypothetical protein